MDWNTIAVWLIMGTLALLVIMALAVFLLYIVLGLLRALAYLLIGLGYVYYAVCTCADFFRLRKWRPEWKARERKEWEKSPEASKRQELLDELKVMRDFMSIIIF